MLSARPLDMQKFHWNVPHSLSSEPNALFRVENRALDPVNAGPGLVVGVLLASQTSDLIPRAPPYTWSKVTSPITLEP